MLKKSQIKGFRAQVWTYYHANKRVFPWRLTTDPYSILVSEVMLQQTQAQRVLEKYPLFLNRFPTLSSLSNASTYDLLTQWSGLGYNRRALNLQTAAKTIEEAFDGVIPLDPKILIKFPGIGAYTACAVVVFSANSPLLMIETNIRRVYLHFFFERKSRVGDREIFPYLEASLDGENPREWYWALMDYGAMLGKTVKNPNKKSAHYKKQSRFEGSLRQTRGIIIRRLLKEKVLEMSKLREIKELNKNFLTESLDQLKKEDFIEVKNGSVRIKEKILLK